MTKLSVIMPVYNTKKEYLKAAIESVLSQTFTDFEFIIIDNGSEDETGLILQQYQDSRIKMFRLDENLGPAGARNFGLKKAVGEFVVFHDSDDISYQNRFEKQIDFFEKNKDIGCLGTSSKFMQNGIEKLRLNTFKSSDEIECYMIFNGCPFTQSSVMLRKDILDKNNLECNLNYVPAEDYKLWVDLIDKTKFHILDDILIIYNFYPENISSLRRQEQEEKTVLIKKECLYPFLEKREANLFFQLLNTKNYSFVQLSEFSEKISFFIDVISKKYPKDLIVKILRKRIKKIFYQTRSFQGQRLLLKSSFGKIFNLPLYWRLWCFLTRGVL